MKIEGAGGIGYLGAMSELAGQRKAIEKTRREQGLEKTRRDNAFSQQIESMMRGQKVNQASETQEIDTQVNNGRTGLTDEENRKIMAELVEETETLAQQLTREMNATLIGIRSKVIKKDE